MAHSRIRKVRAKLARETIHAATAESAKAKPTKRTKKPTTDATDGVCVVESNMNKAWVKLTPGRRWQGTALALANNVVRSVMTRTLASASRNSMVTPAALHKAIMLEAIQTPSLLKYLTAGM